MRESTSGPTAGNPRPDDQHAVLERLTSRLFRCASSPLPVVRVGCRLGTGGAGARPRSRAAIVSPAGRGSCMPTSTCGSGPLRALHPPLISAECPASPSSASIPLCRVVRVRMHCHGEPLQRSGYPNDVTTRARPMLIAAHSQEVGRDADFTGDPPLSSEPGWQKVLLSAKAAFSVLFPDDAIDPWPAQPHG